MPLLALLALFIIVPLAELYVILTVGDAIGAPLTILLLAADSVLGSLLLRSQGRAVWRRFNEALAAGRMPHREVQDGVAVIFGGAFLITPGFITDIFGLLLLLPPTRAVILRIAARRIAKRMTARITVATGAPARLRRGGHRHRAAARGARRASSGERRPRCRSRSSIRSTGFTEPPARARRCCSTGTGSTVLPSGPDVAARRRRLAATLDGAFELEL